jgi:small redox-active disulfide protein 2
MNVQVLGAGCPSCKKLYELTKQAMTELKLTDPVEYITDVSKIIEMGVMSSPVLAVNGKPVMVGLVPDVEKIKKIISSGTVQLDPPNKCGCKGGCC